VVWDDIVGEVSDIDADVLGVNGGGQECPPYTAGLALLGGRTGLRVLGLSKKRVGTWAS
jgi:hypothetical protein